MMIELTPYKSSVRLLETYSVYKRLNNDCQNVQEAEFTSTYLKICGSSSGSFGPYSVHWVHSLHRRHHSSAFLKNDIATPICLNAVSGFSGFHTTSMWHHGVSKWGLFCAIPSPCRHILGPKRISGSSSEPRRILFRHSWNTGLSLSG